MSNQSISLSGFQCQKSIALFGYAVCEKEPSIRVRRPFRTTISFTLLFNVKSNGKSLPVSLQFYPALSQKLHRKIQFYPALSQNYSVKLKEFNLLKGVKIDVKMAYLPLIDKYHTDNALFSTKHTKKISVIAKFTVIPDLDVLDL